jgi:membrane protease YdiL (CAAX protease family)
MEQPASKDYQPDRVDIGFAILLLLTWTLLAWFGQRRGGSLPLALVAVASLCALYSYSVAFTGNCLTRIGWTWPSRQWYWVVGVGAGAAGSCGMVTFLLLADKPLPLRDHRLAVVVLAVTVAPILEEVIFRGIVLSGLLYLCDRLHIQSKANIWLSIILAALLFGFAHSGRTGAPLVETVIMGIVYGWLRVKSDSTAVAGGAHSAFNLVLHLLAR